MTDQEINEAVARKLGRKKLDRPDYSLDHPYSWKNERGGLMDVPDYCHSIEAAWEIVKRMNLNCHVVSIVCEVKTFYVQFVNWGEIWNGPVATKAPMAICLAFLKLNKDSISSHERPE